MPWLIFSIAGGVGYLLGRKGNPLGAVGEDVGEGISKTIQPLLIPAIAMFALLIIFMRER